MLVWKSVSSALARCDMRIPGSCSRASDSCSFLASCSGEACGRWRSERNGGLQEGEDTTEEECWERRAQARFRRLPGFVNGDERLQKEVNRRLDVHGKAHDVLDQLRGLTVVGVRA